MTRKPTKKPTPPKRKARGFLRTGGLLQRNIRGATEKRGFVETRLLTHWAEFVGEATAAVARPVKVGYGREGFGATLTILCNGANAPMLQAELPKIKDRVNACYGYAAISQIRITQTAAIGFGEEQAAFTPQKPKEKRPATPHEKQVVGQTVSVVSDDSLRQALETLGENIVTRDKRTSQT